MTWTDDPQNAVEMTWKVTNPTWDEFCFAMAATGREMGVCGILGIIMADDGLHMLAWRTPETTPASS